MTARGDSDNGPTETLLRTLAGYDGALERSAEPLPRCLPRHGECLPERRPTHSAITENVDDVLHGNMDKTVSYPLLAPVGNAAGAAEPRLIEGDFVAGAGLKPC